MLKRGVLERSRGCAAHLLPVITRPNPPQTTLEALLCASQERALWNDDLIATRMANPPGAQPCVKWSKAIHEYMVSEPTLSDMPSQ